MSKRANRRGDMVTRREGELKVSASLYLPVSASFLRLELNIRNSDRFQSLHKLEYFIMIELRIL